MNQSPVDIAIFPLGPGRGLSYLESTMHKTRLKRVADLLQRRGPYRGKRPIPDEKFDMWDWTCGTTACAVGHACADPWFKAQGLSLRMKRSDPRWPGLCPQFEDFRNC